MIECEIYEDGHVDEERIGGKFFTFKFNTLPRIGDVLWLQLGMGVQIHCTVTYSAQWSSDTHNTGYLIVKIKK